MKKVILILCFVFPLHLTAQVTIRDTTITWHTFRYTLNKDYTINWYTDKQYDTVSVKFNAFILENEFLKIILVPEFGGRILSMIYKPTGHEQLYQNPVGAPYGIGKDWFYYKWLMVYGGIFPTLPEPEHGKAWLLPWDFEIIKMTPDTVSCKMSWKDTVQLNGIDLNKWKYGQTNLRCEFIITMVSGKSSIEADFILYNDLDRKLDYEYWTCLTLAPGSEPENPKCTEGTEIIVPASKIKIPSWYPDIARLEKPVQGQRGIYTFDKLRYWKNWVNDGIIYPWDDKNENFWGVINHDNEEGIIRVADNNVTPGIKIWAWGYNQSQNIDPYKDPSQVHRPYVELWAGHSNEFFEPAHFDMNSVKQWKEVFVPTVGLSNVTHANYNIIADLKIENLQENKIVNLGFVSTYPKNSLDVLIEITGQHPIILTAQTVNPDPVNGNRIKVDLPDNQIWSNSDSLKYTINDSKNGYYLTASVPLNEIITDLAEQITSFANDFLLYQSYPNPFNSSTTLKWYLPRRKSISVKLYNALGEEIAILINEVQNEGEHQYILNADKLGLTSGIYFLTFISENDFRTKKIIYLK